MSITTKHLDEPRLTSTAETFPFLTGRSAVVMDRFCGEHHLGPEDAIRAAVDQYAEWLEEDIATDGFASSGACEYGFASDAIELANGKESPWKFFENEKHVPGSVRFFAQFADRLAKLRKDFGKMPRLIRA